MAGGRFVKEIGRELPGVYVNVVAEQKKPADTGKNGIVVIPLFNHNYGPVGEFIKLTANSIDAEFDKLGYSVLDNDPNRQMLLIRTAFNNATTVYVYKINDGTKATVVKEGLTATAKYKGTRGNAFSIASVANPKGGFDIQIYLAGKKVAQYEKLTNIADLIAKKDKFIDFTGTGALKAFAVSNLAGGTDTVASNENVIAFLDNLELIKFHTVAFFSSNSALQTAAKAKIEYLNDRVGKDVQIVMANATGMNYEGVINITNAFKIDGIALTALEACAWYAGATAAATKMDSLTEAQVMGASEVVGLKNNEAAELAVKNGETFFTMSDSGKVVVAYDINSLTNFDEPKRKDFRKNRVIRVINEYMSALKQAIPPNRYDNREDDWEAIDGQGKAVLKAFDDEHAIKNVDYENDFKADRDNSKGDELYINTAIQPVDSAEKIYITLKVK